MVQMFGELGSKLFGFVFPVVKSSNLVESGLYCATKGILETKKQCSTLSIGSGCIGQRSVQLGCF